jgi:hypothetical protein
MGSIGARGCLPPREPPFEEESPRPAALSSSTTIRMSGLFRAIRVTSGDPLKSDPIETYAVRFSMERKGAADAPSRPVSRTVSPESERPGGRKLNPAFSRVIFRPDAFSASGITSAATFSGGKMMETPPIPPHRSSTSTAPEMIQIFDAAFLFMPVSPRPVNAITLQRLKNR